MKKLFLVRGISGSGKTTFAKELGGVHFETDNYFMVDGEYKFDGTKLKEAHQWCQNEVNNAMILNHTAKINDKIVKSQIEKKPKIDSTEASTLQNKMLSSYNSNGLKNVIKV